MFRRSGKERSRQPVIAPGQAAAPANDADSALERIREKETEIDANRAAVRVQAEEIVAAAEVRAREIRAEAAREAERRAAERAAEIARESEAAIAAREARAAGARSVRWRECERRVEAAAEYLVERVTSV